jgi:disulfide bond formation protein DsbB
MARAGWTPRQGLLAMAVLCIAGVAAALVGQHVFDMRPCPWCILQRIMFVLVAVLCLVGAAIPATALRRVFTWLAVLLSLAGIVTALYQHFVAALSSSCALTFADKVITALHLDALWPAVFEVTGSCADAVVSVLGVPFDFWSAALFAVLAVLGLAALRR